MKIFSDFNHSHLQKLRLRIWDQALKWMIVTLVLLLLFIFSGGIFFLSHIYFFFNLWLRITILGIPIMTMALLSDLGFPPRFGKNRFGLFLKLLFIMSCIPTVLATHNYWLIILSSELHKLCDVTTTLLRAAYGPQSQRSSSPAAAPVQSSKPAPDTSSPS